MKKSVIMQFLVVLLAGAILVTGCGDSGEEGLPNLKVGDQWVYRIMSKGIEHTMIVGVYGEDVINGISCYVFEISVEPPYKGLIDVMTIKRDKKTLEQISVQMSGEYMDTPYKVSSDYSYKFSGVYPYPLEIGKEYTEIVTVNSTVSAMGEKQTTTQEATYIYRIEAMEEITVPAGTFVCYRIVKYDETGTNVIQTSWVSDAIKKYTVKKIDNGSDETSELVSYTLP